MNCPSCGAPMRLASGNASLRCDYCKSIIVAGADDTGVQFLDEAPDFLCPVCEVPLWGALLAAIPIHACKQCHGLLVAMGAMGALVDEMRSKQGESVIAPPLDPADLKRIVPCPQCRRRMDTHVYYGGGHAVISGCEHCELNWLDRGVLMQIVRAPHGSPNPTWS